ncbi:phospholipase [Xenorhabdus kozodoii]|uniref:Phospholipase D n=1 Tax=Xenorhabdus kozodoii TaxID=351676 RepID=A0A2D0LH75_9GAMM|nr:phospholipase [Xenorhabdus kozodoii]PHM74963.1 phospholipase D [Xenorhabdus kozodoii]
MEANKPFYVIAHRVLTEESVKAAIAHGANALEIDCTAWSKGWWADHDGLPTSAGDKAEDIFNSIIKHDKNKQICFIWLDIKNPDYNSDPSHIASIEMLRDLARNILEVNGIKVLFGLTSYKRAWCVLTKELNDSEVVSVNGTYEKVLSQYMNSENRIPIEKRVMDYGYFNLSFEFNITKKELKKGVESNNFGKVFSWTYVRGQLTELKQLVDEVKLDGIIYGFKVTYYYDHEDSREAFKEVKEAFEQAGRKLATRGDFL